MPLENVVGDSMTGAVKSSSKATIGAIYANQYPLRRELRRGAAGRTDERFAFQVLLIAWLFTDKDNFCVGRAFAEYGLCGGFQRSHAWQFFAAACNSFSEAFGSIDGLADCVGRFGMVR